ncbi:hypothetical protein JVT61DRAFT_3985 [Boletus reticuloceps]|uniref:Uncharacterized protein n=1 Tax=Boletus reticuloceps TaxID=495285 RepID=A0A8I2YMR2_9AGAM|nr:hypothetical protein JVT61DRAFT_3985 [Boletus reticuloceps]
MFIKGYPPGTTIDMLLQKQEEEAEMRSRQVASEKVRGWLETGIPVPERFRRRPYAAAIRLLGIACCTQDEPWAGL